MRISDWSSDVCSSDLIGGNVAPLRRHHPPRIGHARDDHVAGIDGRSGGHGIETDRRAGAGIPDEARGRWKRHCQTEKGDADAGRSEEHTSELQSLMRISYAVFCLKKKKLQYDT